MRSLVPPPSATWFIVAIYCAGIVVPAGLRWVEAIAARSLVVYGEGATYIAALLMRDGATYTDRPGVFISANYGPLYYALAALGDPAVSGRVVGLVSMLAVAFFVFLRAHRAPLRQRAALALAFLALPVVIIWAGALRPDALVVALSAAAALLLERAPTRVRPPALLLVLAALAKPTAGITAVALGVWLLRRDRGTALRYLAALVLMGLAALASIAPLGLTGVAEHVLWRNVLPWSAEHALLLVLIAVALLWPMAAGMFLARRDGGPLAAYFIAALASTILGGREGATLNYLLDVCAAGALLAAAHVHRLNAVGGPLVASALVVQLVVAGALIDPARSQADPGALAYARTVVIPGERYLAEEAYLIVSAGGRVDVDDLFLWSRLVARGAIDPSPVLERVRGQRYAAILASADLEHLERAPDYERQRWGELVRRAVLERYELVAHSSGVYVYRPK